MDELLSSNSSAPQLGPYPARPKSAVIVQSCYIPWRGYFDLMDDADVFVVYDCVQYTRRDWRNRNRIKTSQGPRWLTVPVDDARDKTIAQTAIKYHVDWISEHLRWLTLSYQKAPFFETYFPTIESILQKKYSTISELNVSLFKMVREILGIRNEIVYSPDLHLSLKKGGRILEILERIGAQRYISGPAAQSYLDENDFKKREISLEYKTYSYNPYPQMYGEFQGDLSIVDLIMNVGPNSRNFLKSKGCMK